MNVQCMNCGIGMARRAKSNQGNGWTRTEHSCDGCAAWVEIFREGERPVDPSDEPAAGPLAAPELPAPLSGRKVALADERPGEEPPSDSLVNRAGEVLGEVSVELLAQICVEVYSEGELDRLVELLETWEPEEEDEDEQGAAEQAVEDDGEGDPPPAA